MKIYSLKHLVQLNVSLLRSAPLISSLINITIQQWASTVPHFTCHKATTLHSNMPLLHIHSIAGIQKMSVHEYNYPDWSSIVHICMRHVLCTVCVVSSAFVLYYCVYPAWEHGRGFGNHCRIEKAVGVEYSLTNEWFESRVWRFSKTPICKVVKCAFVTAACSSLKI